MAGGEHQAWRIAQHTVQFNAEDHTWLDKRTAPVLLVPSVIVPKEYNLLINPAHPASKKITATVARQYIYDPRLSSASLTHSAQPQKHSDVRD